MVEMMRTVVSCFLKEEAMSNECVKKLIMISYNNSVDYILIFCLLLEAGTTERDAE